MHFEGRDLKPYAEPVTADVLKEGDIYFDVGFVDDNMLVPIMEPVVFIGRNLGDGDVNEFYFQDFESYRNGVRFETAVRGDAAEFEVGEGRPPQHIYEFDKAIDVLLSCTLRRRKQDER